VLSSALLFKLLLGFASVNSEEALFMRKFLQQGSLRIFPMYSEKEEGGRGRKRGGRKKVKGGERERRREGILCL
jgi:hypothetical protein